MSGPAKSCPGHYDYMEACSDNLRVGNVTRKFWKFKSRCLHAVWHLENYGLLHSLEFALSKVIKLLSTAKKQNPTVPLGQKTSSDGEVLNLKPNEIVEVRPEQQIMQTLDSSGKNKGLLFMPCMRKFCGKRFRVHKRIERIRLESTGEYRRLKNTVLLEGVMCDGLEFGGCDRSCFHYWREVWLERVGQGREVQYFEVRR